jgi:hypothetical protein
MNLENRMCAPRSLIPVALALLAAGCSDATGPVRTAVQQPLAAYGESPTELRMLRQAPTAPPLWTYQVSFWAYKGRASTVTVNYQPAVGDSVGRPFLRFDIPKNGLLGGAGGVPLEGGDSVFVTMTIDTVRFLVDFQPSGVRFSIGSEARLVLWYGNADPDLNGDGVVDAADQALRQQLAVWYHATKTDPWYKLSSSNDPTLPSISTAVHHFSAYAVSW